METTPLRAALKGLKPRERTVIELLSLFYLPVGETPLIESQKRLGDPPGPTETSAVLERLAELGLAVRERTGWRCSDAAVEEVTLRCAEEGRLGTMVRALPAKNALASALEEFGDGVRDLRLSLYANDKVSFCERLAGMVNRHANDYHRDPPLSRLALAHWDSRWLDRMEQSLRSLVVQGVMLKGGQSLLPGGTVVEWLEKQCKGKNGQATRLQKLFYLEHLMLSDQLDAARKLAGDYPSVQGWLEFEKGRYDKSLGLLEEALKVAQREAPGKASLTGYAGFLLPVVQMRQGKLEEARRYLEGLRGLDMEALTWLCEVRRSGGTGLPEWLPRFRKRDATLDGQDTLGVVLALHWAGLEEACEFVPRLESLAARARANGYLWVERQLLALVRVLKGESGGGLVDALAPEEAWRRSLDALFTVAHEARPVSDHRVIWRVEEVDGQYSVRPLVQKRSKKGDWTSGRDLLPARILNQHSDCLLEQDRQALRTLVQGLDSYRVGDESTLAELVGHPYVFWEHQPELRVEVQKGNPELRVLRQGDRVVVDVQPVLPYFSADVGVLVEGAHRLRLFRLTEAQKEIARIIGKGLKVPAEAADELHDAVESLSPLIGVQSDISGSFAGAEEVEPLCGPHLFLLPHNGGLRLEMRVRPLGPTGPALPPGQGGRAVLAERKGRRVQATRNLEEEFSLAAQILEACPTLTQFGPGGWNWLIEQPVDCLEVLEEVAQLPEGKLALHWPEGETFSVKRPAGELEMKVKKDRNWFAVDGQLQVDEDTVLDVAALLARMENAHGRFIDLGNGQFLALTEKFRRRLEQLADLNQGKDGVKLDPLAAAVAFEGDAEVKGDKHFKEHLARLKSSFEEAADVPSTLQARLREYQVEGYRWLSRLSSWGVGACLADDMGLGKTLQALAVILARARFGPTLVVAPTSVCSNWAEEASRFAPSLRPVLFAESDRTRVVEELQPFDLLIVSYGLLTRETELLSAPTWNTLVLDEAQNIKNFQTKRFKAAEELKAEFRVVTTGTPVENNLDELWTLFRFLNPGLLGSRDRFSSRFTTPIERGDRAARSRLRDMVRPFILRRIKSEVLDELPPKTEVTLRIDLSEQEKGLYENLRRRALEKVEGEEVQPLAVLAELTRLRRAVCHPDLVAPEDALEASKLEAFRELVTELVEGGHKALVFSQFVDVLTILRETLDSCGITYQYLDGSTPAKERAKRVAAFQAGEGDLFLISLRAGGVGLNLTAADYVIHYDPWWNPAVEDQASDRAYRMGQTRPVTIYRLVARGTVEDKIVELHREKRELAEGILEGSDQAASLSSTDLLELLRS